MKSKVISITKLIFIWLILILFFGEILTRIFVEFPLDFVDEKTSCYRYDDELGWFPKENCTCVHQAKFDTKIKHNKDGFRDRNHVNLQSNKSIAFLGDSFVWGYDVKAKKRFTNIIQKFLPKWEVYNMGISGYGTDQELLLLKKWYPKYKPKHVILLVHSNDDPDNETNLRYTYYKPYFINTKKKIVSKGIPVPKSYRYYCAENPVLTKSSFIKSLFLLKDRVLNPKKINIPSLKHELIKEMDEFLKKHNSQLYLVFTYPIWQRKEKKFLSSAGIPYRSLPTDLKFKDYGQHWTPEGHSYISSKILEWFYLEGIINDLDLDKNPKLD